MHIEAFEGKGKQWHWHFRAKNGKITADSEAFPTKVHATRAAKAVVRAVIKRAYGRTPDFVTRNVDGVTTITWS